MKKITVLSFLIILCKISFSQFDQTHFYTITFEDANQLNHLNIDYTSNQNNIWQIGNPQKTIFTNALSGSKVIITDTLNSYPTNDTSSFIIDHIASGGGFQWQHTVILEGNYQVNSDTLTDFGTIEFSPDNGLTWIDLINDSNFDPYLQWFSPKPVLTGNSNGWEHFMVYLAQLGPLFNIQYGDTVLYRFTFTSDGIESNKDGLMYDDLHFEDWVEGLSEYENENLIRTYPNPVTNQLRIEASNSMDKLESQIFNLDGQLIISESSNGNDFINVSLLENGFYILKCSNGSEYAVKKFLVQH